jgi:hypothetical protein
MAKKLKHFLVIAETAIGDVCGYMVCPKKEVCDALPVFLSEIGNAVELKETFAKRTKLTYLEGENIEMLRNYLRSNPNTSAAMEKDSDRLIVCWLAASSSTVHAEWGHA